MFTFGLDPFRAALRSYASRRVLAGAPEAALSSEAISTARSIGLETIRIMRVHSRKARCVVLCRHPEWGLCVFKLVSRLGPSGGVRTHIDTTSLVRRTRFELFPQVFEIGTNYSVEAFIDGEMLHDLPETEWGNIDLPGLFRTLRGFRQPSHDTPLSGDDACAIVSRYAMLAIKSADYMVKRVSFFPVVRLATNSQASALLRVSLELARNVALPRSWVIDDLTTRNLMRCRQTGRLFIVDIEHLKEGFAGYDSLWLIAGLPRTECPFDIIYSLRRTVCTDAYCSVAGGGVLMSAVSALIFEMLGTYVSSGRTRRACWSARDEAIEELRRNSLWR